MNNEEKLPDVLHFDDPIAMNLGMIIQWVPAIVVWNLARQLRADLLEEYEVVQGVSTPDNPNPQPFLRRKAVE